MVTFDALQEFYQPGITVAGVTILQGGVHAGFRVVHTFYAYGRRTLFGAEISFHMPLEFAGDAFAVVEFEEVLSV